MIFKVFKKKQNFYPVSNQLAQNRTLSYEARGLLIEILSRPPGWNFSMNRMVTVKPKQGISKVRRIFKELEKAGYLCFWIEKDKKNQFVINRGWAASEEPLDEEEFALKISPDNQKNVYIVPQKL